MPKTSTLNYKEYPPRLPLSDFIECFWTLETSAVGAHVVHETLVPGGRVELMFSSSPFLWYGTDRTAKATSCTGSFLLGQRNCVSYASFKEGAFVFGVRFRYGCAPLFLKHSARRYSNTVVLLNELSFHEALPVIGAREQEGVKSFIQKVENWLLSCMEVPTDDWRRLQNLIQYVAGQNPESIVLGDLFEKYGWNYKKVERVFVKYLGFPPGTFLKLFRFRNVLEKMKAKPASFTDTAHRLGFYDQSHFIREFRTYTGSNPSSFFKDPPEVAVLLYKLKR